jgi:hypothetical protein
MRLAPVVVTMLGACGGSAAGTDAAVTPTPNGGDAAVDCAMPMLYESATLPAGPFNMLPAVLADGDDFIGVRFTTTERHVVRCLGATIFTDCQSCDPVTMAMAIVPLDATTQLPFTTSLGDAVVSATGVIPYYPSGQLPMPPAPAAFPVSFALPAGSWGLVVASDRLGVPFHAGNLPINVTPAGAPSFFHYTESGDTGQTPGQWLDGLADETVRLFVTGD